MSDPFAPSCTAFEGTRRLASGSLSEVARAVKAAVDGGSLEPVLVFDDASGQVIDFDLRGSEADVIARLPALAARLAPPQAQPLQTEGETAAGPRGKGRPKLGVIAREVTLLPRHWDWLAAQQGGASAALRRLVEQARRAGGASQQRRMARETAYRFISAMAGNLAGFEEATRALFADDRPRMEAHMATWPQDIRDHTLRLAWGAHVPSTEL
ncbi:hypothetical protein SAMN05216304_103713 [Bosea sp. OK403]|uniref:DUF2239 family protein n=1 Tax=Bosea sp. OK403 TaxID=1855286 RepID=UPI0008E44DC5|nr:DUF2239 family protein [Bosea sp. OK403]SFI84086.1 hypothetical protein SAMN05216304_103713 [Bosea sp. OK403]